MRKLLILLGSVVIVNTSLGQANVIPPKTEIMTLGVFHFAYPNLDVVKTAKENQISVLDEPYQSEIIAISNAISSFKPTVIAVEINPTKQSQIDIEYSQYKSNYYNLKKNEAHQLGFRIGKKLNLPVIYCIGDMGHHYDNLIELMGDSIRTAKLVEYIENSPDSIYKALESPSRVSSIIDELARMNEPNYIKESLSGYLLNPFKYEEQSGDFIGVDFETGRWFNRNLRIFRNIQRIPHTADDRILLIIGSGHLNLLNPFFDVSKEFELVSPLPYLEKARCD